MAKTNREKEDIQMEKVFQPEIKEIPSITKLIQETLRSKHKVYVVTDLHLYTAKEKNKPECVKRVNFNKVVKNQAKCDPQDLVINLGDLVDGEYTEQKELRNLLLTFPGKKILVRGNNDIFTNQFYKSCGFQEVVYGFEYRDIVFTHVPVVHTKKMNIHGHIHCGVASKRTPQYWVPYNNHIDVFSNDREMFTLLDIMHKQPAYSRDIKFRIDKFIQECSDIEYNIAYTNYRNLYIDPCND